MKKIILFAAIIVSINNLLVSQNPEFKGLPVVEIFADFHLNAVKDTNTTGFSLNRAYFGYVYPLDKNFSASLILDIGTPEDLAKGSKPRRYAHFREASIGYAEGKLSLTLGISGTRIFKFQQTFWGKRYIAKPYQSINGYGFIADLGLVADYKINEIVDLDLTVMNGEGYTNIQTDNSVKTSVGATITPVKSLAFRIYSDFMMQKGMWQSTIVGFAGFKNDKMTIGAEASYKSNLDLIQGHHAWGVSGTVAFNLTKKLEFFTRYDYSTSIIPQREAIQWNISKDGQFLINGFQYNFNKTVKISLNNQATIPKEKTRSVTDLIFVSALFKF
jgi:hypothetical protein